MRDAQQNRLSGPSVRWGGSVVTVTPHADQTCFEIVSHPLDAAARPQETDDTDGRFIACISGFYDPAVYEAGREVTVVGTIADGIDGKIGERAYRFPRVDAAHVYLWPKREPTIMYGPVYDPFWHPFWWGPIYPRHRNY